MGGVIDSVIPLAQTGLGISAIFLPQPFNFVAAGASFGLGLFGGFMAAGPKTPNFQVPDFNSFAQDRVVVVRSSVTPHRIVYGETKISGPIVFAETRGGKQQFLEAVVALTGHESESIESTYLGEDEITQADMTGDDVTSGKYSGQVSIFEHLGASDQAADAHLVSVLDNWTGNHRGRGITYIVLALEYERDLFPNGIPNIAAKVRGRKIWDPRDTSQDSDDAATWAHSNNWALCVLDYMRADFGLAATLDEINLASFVTAANISEEPVETGVAGSSSQQARYTCDGVIDLADEPIEIMADMLTAGAGSLSYSQGEYHLFAGAAVTPTRTLTADDLAGALQVDTKVLRKDLFNEVRGTFVDPEQFYQPQDFPARSNANYVTQDFGEVVARDIELAFTQDPIRAQRIAEIILRKSRQGIVVNFPAKLTALPLAVYDTVMLTLNDTGANFGWHEKVFRILAKRFNQTGGLDLVLQEEDATSYDWDEGSALEHDPAPDTNLPDPFTVNAPQGIAFASGSDHLFVDGAGSVVSRINVTWASVNDIYVEQGGQIEIQYRDAALGGAPLDWTDGSTQPVIISGNSESAYLAPVQDGVTYDIRVRSFNQLGIASDRNDEIWEQTLQHLVVGKTEAPSDLDTFTVARMADGTRRYEWTHIGPEADVRVGGGYKLRYLLGATSDWDEMTALHMGILTSSPHENNELAAGTYTFAMKAVDSTGNESTNAAFVTATLGNPRLRSVLVGRLEHDLGFPGTKTDCFVDDDRRLKSIGVGGWDGLPIGSPGEWNDLAASWDGILPSPSRIVYSIEIDLGADLSFQPLVTVEGDGTPTIEMRTGPDGGSPQVDGAYTSLAPVVNRRYIEIRVTMASDASPSEPTAIETLTILLDGETVVEDFNDIDTSGPDSDSFERIAAGHFVIATLDLTIISQASITAIQNVGPGWTWELISKTVSPTSPPGPIGAEFKLYNAADTLADATIDVSLKGPKIE